MTTVLAMQLVVNPSPLVCMDTGESLSRISAILPDRTYPVQTKTNSAHTLTRDSSSYLYLTYCYLMHDSPAPQNFCSRSAPRLRGNEGCYGTCTIATCMCKRNCLFDFMTAFLLIRVIQQSGFYTNPWGSWLSEISPFERLLAGERRPHYRRLLPVAGERKEWPSNQVDAYDFLTVLQ